MIWNCPVCDEACEVGYYAHGIHSVECFAGHYKSYGNLYWTEITIDEQKFLFSHSVFEDQRKQEEQNQLTEQEWKAAINKARKKYGFLDWQKVGF